MLGSKKYEISEVPINEYSLHMNLKVLNVQKHDFGGYLCSSVNALGKVEGSVRLQGKWKSYTQIFFWLFLALHRSRNEICFT